MYQTEVGAKEKHLGVLVATEVIQSSQFDGNVRFSGQIMGVPCQVIAFGRHPSLVQIVITLALRLSTS